MFKWSTAQAIALPISFIIIIGLGFLFRKFIKKDKYKYIFIVISAIILGLELAKQIYFLASGKYTAWQLPLQFCSLFMIFFPLTHFFGEKMKRIFKPMSLTYSLFVVVVLLVHPTSMIGGSAETMFASFPNFHAYYFHILVCAYAIFTFILDDYEPQKTDSINTCLGVVFYSTYAIPCAFALNQNYLCILRSYVGILENFRLTCGQLAYDIVIIALGLIGVALVPVIYYYVKKLIKKRREKNAT